MISNIVSIVILVLAGSVILWAIYLNYAIGKSQRENTHTPSTSDFLNEQEREKEDRRKMLEREYSKFLRSDTWKELRRKALNRANHKCQRCKKAKATQVVHKRRPRDYWEEAEDTEKYVSNLLALCQDCAYQRHRPSDWDDPRNPFFMEPRANKQKNGSDQMDLFGPTNPT